MKKKIKEVSIHLFNSVLTISANQHGTFRLLVTIQIDDQSKPLFIVGNAHSEIEDGHCIAVLNPEKSLMNEVIAGCAYTGSSLKGIVQGKCDAMVELWIDAYKTDGVGEISSYTSRAPQNARFEVK